MEGLCEICAKVNRQYQCPRCGLYYCSTNCYRNQSHSDCSEEFYKECIQDELRNEQVGVSESHRRMYDILERLHKSDGFDIDAQEELDSDDDDETSLAERLADVDLNDVDKVWCRLSNEEKHKFEELLKSGDVTDIVPPFDPWWNHVDDRKIVELDESASSRETYKDICPKFDTGIIVPFSQLSRKQPANTICYNVANVLAIYTFTVRFYNNDHYDFVNESTAAILSGSRNLSCNENFSDIESAVLSVVLEISKCNLFEGCDSDSDDIRADVIRIFEGPNKDDRSYYVLAALGDIHNLFSTRLKMQTGKRLSVPKVDGDFSKRFKDHQAPDCSIVVTRTKLKELLKKLEYCLAWASEHYMDPLTV